jgi:hypothetical protein
MLMEDTDLWLLPIVLNLYHSLPSKGQPSNGQCDAIAQEH